jgi:hypothetical protein
MIRITITFHEAFNVNRQRFQDDVAFAIDLPGGIDIPNGFILKIKLKIINLLPNNYQINSITFSLDRRVNVWQGSGGRH